MNFTRSRVLRLVERRVCKDPSGQNQHPLLQEWEEVWSLSWFESLCWKYEVGEISVRAKGTWWLQHSESQINTEKLPEPRQRVPLAAYERAEEGAWPIAKPV